MRRILSALLALLMLTSAASAGDMGFAVIETIYTPGENIVFSPLSMNIALNMAAEGALGATRDEILAVANEKMSDEIHSANAVFVSPGVPLEKTYTDVVDQKYAAEFFPIDDSIVPNVNQWVEKQTDGMIKDFMLRKPASDTGLILINAVSMQKDWRKPFDAENTRREEFFTANETVSVDMMHQTDRFRYAEVDGTQIICLPYADSALEMWIAMPEEGKMPELLKNLSASGVEYIISETESRKVVLSLPKIDLGCDIELTEPLQILGMKTAFTDSADFSGISQVPLRVGSVCQKARIEMNEKPTKAAAVTQFVMLDTALAPGSEPEPVVMTVNRPCFFAVYDGETGAVCFAGVIENPKM